MEVQRIRTDLPGRKPRNVNRVVLEVEVTTQNGTAVGPHRAKQGISRVEVYADHLPKVAAKTQSEEHRRAYEAAKAQAQYHTDQWCAERGKAKRGKSETEWREYVERHCNFRPEQYLPIMGYPDGMPPISRCDVVSVDGLTTVPLADFLKLSRDEQRPFLGEPPETLEGARVAQTDAIQQIAQAFAMANAAKADDSRKGRR